MQQKRINHKKYSSVIITMLVREITNTPYAPFVISPYSIGPKGIFSSVGCFSFVLFFFLVNITFMRFIQIVICSMS